MPKGMVMPFTMVSRSRLALADLITGDFFWADAAGKNARLMMPASMKTANFLTIEIIFVFVEMIRQDNPKLYVPSNPVGKIRGKPIRFNNKGKK
jgi:hypothetical protein